MSRELRHVVNIRFSSPDKDDTVTTASVVSKVYSVTRISDVKQSLDRSGRTVHLLYMDIDLDKGAQLPHVKPEPQPEPETVPEREISRTHFRRTQRIVERAEAYRRR